MVVITVGSSDMARRKAGGAFNVAPTVPGSYGDYVRRLRNERGWTQEELAQRVEAWMREALGKPDFNYTQNTLSSLERGAGSPNRRLMHHAFAAVFGMQPAVFELRARGVVDPGLDLKIRALSDAQRKELDDFITARYLGERNGGFEVIEDDGTMQAFVELLEARPTAEQVRQMRELLRFPDFPDAGGARTDRRTGTSG